MKSCNHCHFSSLYDVVLLQVEVTGQFLLQSDKEGANNTEAIRVHRAENLEVIKSKVSVELNKSIKCIKLRINTVFN